MEVLTACNVDVYTAFHNEPHFDVNKTNDIEHAPYEEMSVNVNSKSKSVSNVAMFIQLFIMVQILIWS